MSLYITQLLLAAYNSCHLPQEPKSALIVVNNLTSSDSELVEPVVVVYLLVDILDRTNVTEDVDSPQQFVEVCDKVVI